MLTDEEIPKVSKVFEALGNPIRLKILNLVVETSRPLHIKAVAKIVKKDYAAVYRHVKILEESGLIEIYDVGRSRVLSPKNKEFIKMLIEKAKSYMEKH
ncbi:winged helix-turn-helix transcriptional regulator [Candidatus Bathyarchaeota archaeon]|nr:winged helix-turn-helix transcriptional regulator [Candidatus Bathyarchaeota archaeon]